MIKQSNKDNIRMCTNQNLEKLYELYSQSSGIATDSRKIVKNKLFFALSGPNFDGNKYVNEAIVKGAISAVCNDNMQKGKKGIFYVDNVLEALQSLATFHRRKFDIPVLAITGSNGKTTTKSLITLVLSTKYKTHSTYKNLNNHIGVPLTLLSMPLDTEVAVIEMGANKIGDIKELCGIAEPNYGFITNIGYAHTLGFGGIQGVLKGKTELFYYLMEESNHYFRNEDDEFLVNVGKDYDNTISFKSDNFFELLEEHPFLKIKYKEKKYITNMFGLYNLKNISATVAIAEEFGISIEESCRVIAQYIPGDGRSQWIEKKDNKLILDAYNANPTSLKVALTSFLKSNAPNKVVILGEMLELEFSDDNHKDLGYFLEQYSEIKKIIYIGRKMIHAHAISKLKVPSIFHEDTDEAIASYFSTNNNDIKDCTVFIKGSRAMMLEKIVEYL